MVNYLRKYLKYKKKYISLIQGGNNESDNNQEKKLQEEKLQKIFNIIKTSINTTITNFNTENPSTHSIKFEDIERIINNYFIIFNRSYHYHYENFNFYTLLTQLNKFITEINNIITKDTNPEKDTHTKTINDPLTRNITQILNDALKPYIKDLYDSYNKQYPRPDQKVGDDAHQLGASKIFEKLKINLKK